MEKSEIAVKRAALGELKELAYNELPKPQENWNLIWVFSGPHGFFQEGTRVRKGVDGLIEDIGDETNEAVSRLNTGVEIAKQVTARRLNKKAEEITIDDIRISGPKIFYNEWDWQNDELRKLFNEGNGEEQFSFPKNNLIIPDNTQVMHTGHQFEKFPEEVLDVIGDDGKFVLVSDLYHLPRIERYAWKRFPQDITNKMVLYPSQPLVGSTKLFVGELNKIISYGKNDQLAWYPQNKEV
jgi:hypothetical protein